MSWLTHDWTTGQLNALVKKIGEENARGILAGTVELKITEKTVNAEVFSVKLGGQTTTDEIVKAWRDAGLYVSDYITQANFPLTPHDPEDVKIEVIDPGRCFSETEGIELLKDAGLRRPTYEHALRFAEQCGMVTTGKKPYIIFLHESWLGPSRGRRVVCVDRGSDDRELRLFYPDDGFNDYCVLAGVRPQ